MARFFNKGNLIRAGILLLAALLLAAGLEWLMLRTLPPIFVDSEVEIPSDPGLIARSATYLHFSGRLAVAEEWHWFRFLVEFLLQLGILIILFPLGLGKKIISAVKGAWLSLKRVFTEEKSRNWKLLCCFALAWVAAFFLSKAWILDLYHRDNWITQTVCALIGVCAGCLVTFRRTLAKKPEVLFLVFTLIYGGIMCYFYPDATRVSVDDGYHFQHAANYSTLGHVRFTGAEWDAMQSENEKEGHLDIFEDFRRAQDEKYAEGAVFVTTGFHLDPKEYWMATQGLGLFLGRLFHLRFWDMWSLGRFTGLLAYTLIGYFAIRRLKSGKMILSLALMLPTSVFLASNYSYDPGVTAGIYLSFSYWIAQWQEWDQKLKNKDVVVMVAGMLFACYAKAIYFPIMLLFLFLPRSKFRDQKHRRNYSLIILFAIVVVMLYILLPMARSGGQGDDRASGDVNTFSQVDYILSQPLDYALTLWHEIEEYLDPNNMTGATNAFGYTGGGRCTTLILMILAVAAFTDQTEEGLLPPAWVRAAGQVVLFGSLALMLTSMYVWFSEVGSIYFDGVQERYLIPFIYPAMALLGSNRSKSQVDPALYNGLLFAAMLFASFAGVILTCIEVYV